MEYAGGNNGRATITGTMRGSESRGRRVESCYHQLCCDVGLKCVLVCLLPFVGEASADTSDATAQLVRGKKEKGMD